MNTHSTRWHHRHAAAATAASLALLIATTSSPASTLPVYSDHEVFNYTGDVLPTADPFAWSLTIGSGIPESAHASVNNGVLTIDTLTGNANSNHFYSKATSLLELDRAGAGYLIEVGLNKVATEFDMETVSPQHVRAGFAISIRDGYAGGDGQLYNVGIDEDSVAVATGSGADNFVSSGSIAGYDPDAENLWSIWRFEDKLNIYLNGNAVLQLTGFAGGDNASAAFFLSFGNNNSSRDGHYEIDFIRAGQAIPEPGTLALLVAGTAVMFIRRRQRTA